MSDPFYEHYKQLIGKTVKGVALDESDAMDWTREDTYGIVFDDGSIAWILQDPEGNGPGFLEIAPPGTVDAGSKATETSEG